MPELPEVETVCRGLRPVLEGVKIVETVVNIDKLRFDIPSNIMQITENIKVKNIKRRAKYIILEMENGWTLGWHLGMSGKMIIDNIKRKAQKHDHIIIKTSNGKAIFYNDPRRFGYIFTEKTNKITNSEFLKDLGPEPLEIKFTGKILFDKIKKRKAPIKNILLNQKIVAGLGNIYICEALFYAKINPKIRACDLTLADCKRLVPIIKDILKKAIKAGGSTLKDYKQASGEMGYFQYNFAVYGREKESCKNSFCNSKIKRITQAGRATFYCPKCQKSV